MSGKSEQLCRFFARGKICYYGDECRYQHTSVNLSPEVADTGTGSAEAISNTVASNFDKLVSITKDEDESLNVVKGSEARSTDSKLSLKTRRGKVCSYFAKNGHCTYGNNCRFIHEVNISHHNKPKNIETTEGLQELVPEGRPQKALSRDSNIDEPLIKEPSEHNDETDDIKICHYFSRTGRCRFGARCRFQHVRNFQKDKPQKQKNVTPSLLHSEKAEESKTLSNQKQEASGSQLPKSEPKAKKRLCPYFKMGDCKWGTSCRLFHPVRVMEDVTDDQQSSGVKIISTDVKESSNEVGDNSVPKTSQSDLRRPQPGPRSFLNRAPVRPVVQKISVRRDGATEESLVKLRDTEVNQLQKRFPKDRCCVLEDKSGDFQCRVNFRPSDPDWPFDVKNFDLQFEVPLAYPKEMLSISLPEDQDLPETVRRYIEVCITEWVAEKRQQLEDQGVYEIVFRPFLRWFDKTLEAHVTEALRQMKRELVAKAAGFKFIAASELQTKYKPSENSDGSDSENKESEGVDDDGGEDSESDSNDGGSDDHFAEVPKEISLDVDPEKKGTEIVLKNLQLRENASTLLFEKIHVIIQCKRCKNRTNFSTPSQRINAVPCSKCNQTQMLTYRPSLLHQFSSVMGYLDLEDCTAFDLALQESVAVVSCLNCSRDTKLDGLAPGQVSDTWCRHCHQKLRVATEAVRFSQLQPSGIVTDSSQGVHQVAVQRKRVLKDPAIKEGKPLPDFGACKHYKKSFRWFRFPCCGMVYPCDICHDDKEGDHEMKFANRVICGFCCKEQVYAPDKPCVLCLQMLTRGKSAHWEGGQGCRDRIKMSRNDNQKFSNMNKTISKHAQKLKENNSKKRTKLRHT